MMMAVKLFVKIAVMMMAPGGTPAPPEARGREPPFFFFLDFLPRWEKGFPSGPWSPWHGRGESPFEIRFVSLSLYVSALADSALSPFLKFPEIHNSNWAEIWTRFLSGYWLSCGERRAPTALRSGHEGLGRALPPRRAPDPRGPPVRRLMLFFCRKKGNFTRKIWAKDSPQSELRIAGYKRNGEGAELENAETERDREIDPISEGLSPLPCHGSQGSEGKPSPI